MTAISTIIVDDEKLARQELNYLASELPHLKVLACCGDVEDAMEKINQLTPDLVFLDIEMPEKNGFELLASLDYSPNVVFVTAYDHYAIKAFDRNALDYLLKPTTVQRLSLAVDKVSERLNLLRHIDTSLARQIFVKDGGRCYFISLHEIYLLQSAGNYCTLYWRDTRCMLHKTLKQLESVLPVQHFIRVNRQQILNSNFIAGIETYYHGGMLLTLRNGKTIQVSHRNAVGFKMKMRL